MMKVNASNTALVITDPQNDFLSPKGVTWGMVGDSVAQNKTVEHIEDLFKAAKERGINVFISPHYYYPTDHGWAFEGTLEKAMHDIKMFDRKDALSLNGFEGSGADWLERYKSYILTKDRIGFRLASTGKARDLNPGWGSGLDPLSALHWALFDLYLSAKPISGKAKKTEISRFPRVLTGVQETPGS